jgi:hypothetical protein
MNKASATGFALAAIVCLSVPTLAVAQDKGDAGISMGYPSTIAFVYHLSDRVAVRPAISFIRTASDTNSAFGDIISSRSLTYDVSVSGLFYVGRWDKVRAYVGTGYSYRRSGGSIDSTDLPTFDRSTLVAHAVSGSFGAQYALHERLSVFGEAGIQYSRSGSESSLGVDDDRFRATSSRTAVGVVFYF